MEREKEKKGVTNLGRERGGKQGEGEGGRGRGRGILGERLGDFNHSKEREARGEGNEVNLSSV